MTIVLVKERKYHASGKPDLAIRKDKNGIPVVYTKFEEYYMDLSAEEEKKLRETGHFGFTAVRSYDVDKIDKTVLQKGERRKRAVLKG